MPQGSSAEHATSRQPVVEHLEELRRRLWVCIATVVVGAGLCFTWAETLIQWLMAPAGATLRTLAFFGPAEGFLAHVTMAFGAGLAVSMPVLLGQVWGFARPALTSREHRYGMILIWMGTLLFFGGMVFAYVVLLPFSLRFLLTYGGPLLEPVISVRQYLGFTMTIVLATGAMFELPLVVVILTKLGVVEPAWLRRQWRMAYLVIVIAAAVLTPTPDVVTMLLMALPMLALYECSILLAWWARPRDRGHDDAA